jgi:hypothetical protein
VAPLLRDALDPARSGESDEGAKVPGREILGTHGPLGQSEYFGIPEGDVRDVLGEEYRWLNPDEVNDLLGNVEQLLPLVE